MWVGKAERAFALVVQEIPRDSEARNLRAQLLSHRFSLQELTSYNVVSLMTFTKRDILNISQRITWRETTSLGKVRTACHRYVSSKAEALCVLRFRLAMPSRL
mgnify:FL=1